MQNMENSGEICEKNTCKRLKCHQNTSSALATSTVAPSENSRPNASLASSMRLGQFSIATLPMDVNAKKQRKPMENQAMSWTILWPCRDSARCHRPHSFHLPKDRPTTPRRQCLALGRSRIERHEERHDLGHLGEHRLPMTRLRSGHVLMSSSACAARQNISGRQVLTRLILRSQCNWTGCWCTKETIKSWLSSGYPLVILWLPQMITLYKIF